MGQPIQLKPRDSPLRLVPYGSVAPNGPPHSLTRPSLTPSSLTLTSCDARGDGVAAMAAAALQPAPSSPAVATYQIRTAACRSIDLSAWSSPSLPLLANRLRSGSRGESPLAIDELRRALVLADDGCAPGVDLARVLLAVLVPSPQVLATVVLGSPA